MKHVEDITKLDDLSLAGNVLAAQAMSEGIASISSPEHLASLCRATFNLMVDKCQNLSITDTMKINMLAFALDSGLNIVKMQEAADAHLAALDAELIRRTKENDDAAS